MTRKKERGPFEQFCHLLGSQIIIRAAVSRCDLRSGHEHCTIELVSACPHLYDPTDGWKASGFVQLRWYCGYEEKKGDMHSPPFDFPTFIIERGVVGDESLDRVPPRMEQVLERWRNGVTGDGPRPYEEWLEPKPFVAVASVGIRPKARVEILQEDARPLLVYYGCLLGKLDAYLGHLELISREYDEGLNERRLLIGHLAGRFQSFVHQRQLWQFDRTFA